MFRQSIMKTSIRALKKLLHIAVVFDPRLLCAVLETKTVKDIANVVKIYIAHSTDAVSPCSWYRYMQIVTVVVKEKSAVS
jgi:hypothetical protein